MYQKIFSAALLAAFLLAIEFGVIFVANFFGLGEAFRVRPGVYSITTENYEEYIMLCTSRDRIRIEAGEKRTEMMRQTENDMTDYPIVNVVPAATHRALFDLDESKSIDCYDDYKPTPFLSRNVQKYQIIELYVRYEVTYSYQGVETKVEREFRSGCIEKAEDGYLTADFPEEAMRSKEQTYVSNMKGDSYTQTVFWPEVDYWSVTILEVSGVAEVQEVESYGK